MPSSIINPIHATQVINLPAGTLVRSTNPHRKGPRALSKAQSVTVRIVSDGWVDCSNYHKRGSGYVVLPTITWPGAGGYWQDAQVTPDLLEANSLPALVMPELESRERLHLDVEPSFDRGYTSQWELAVATVA